MMTRWRLIGLIVMCGAGLAVAFVASRNPKHRSQPEVKKSYKNLPTAFHDALQKELAQLPAKKNDSAVKRKLAHLYHANGLFSEARQCYQSLEETPPGLTARDHYYLADIDAKENDLDGAQAQLRAVLNVEASYLPAQLALAEALFKTGKEDEAEKVYLGVLAAEPAQPQAAIGLARIELQRGSDDAAASRLEDLMASHPESTAGAALFAQVLSRRGEADRAEAMTQWSAQKPEPISADPWMAELLTDCYDVQRLALLFEGYIKTGQIEQARPFLQRVEELEPASPAPELLLGWSESQNLHHPDAVRHYRLALAKGGDPEKICPYLVESMLAVGDISAASKLMADYYARMPDSIPILNTYSDVVLREGNIGLARELLTKLVHKEPYLYSANVGLGKLLWAAGERDAAVECLKRIAMVNAGDIASRALLGEYFLEKSDPASAIRPLEQAVKQTDRKIPLFQKLTSMLEQAYVEAGASEEKKGRVSESIVLYDKAIELAPTDPRAYAYKANICARNGHFQPAAEALRKMIALQPENPAVHLSLGDVVYQGGAKDEAGRHWRKALELVPAEDAAMRSALNERLAGHVTEQTFK